jgi:epidermal growth factor receptor substrate 15
VAIANTKNQLDSTQASLTKAQADRARIEAAVTESAAQLAQLESQLASAKAQYQTETKLLKDMQTRQQEQMANIRSTREELIHAESELSGLRAEKAEIEGAVLRDKEDIRELQRKLREAHEQTNLAKAELEKLKKDARQQKGLLVIAKKQLASAEENAEKARKEAEVERLAIATANEDLAKTNSAIEELALKEPQAVSSAMAADPVALPASIPLPVTPEVLSAALSSKSNNPFGRLTQANSSTPSPTAFSSITLPAAASSAFEADHETASQTTREADPFNAAFGLDEPEQETPAFSSNLTPTVSKSLSQDILDSGAKESSRPPVSSGLDELATPKPETSTFVPFDAVEVENPTKLEAPQVDRPPTQYARHGDDSSDDEQEIEDAAPMRRLTPTITPDLSNGTLPAPLLFGEPVAEPAMTVMQPDAQGSSAANTTLAPKPSASFDDTSRFDEAVSATTPAAAEPTTPSSPKKSNSLFAALAPPPTKTGSVSRSPLSSVKRQSTGTSLFDDTAFVAQTSRFPPVSSSDTPPASSAELDDAFGTRTAINSAAANGSARPTAFEQSFEDSFDFGATPNLPLATAQLPAEVSALTATTTNGHSPAISTPFYTPHSSSAAANWPSSPVASIAANTQQPLYKPPSSPPPPASAFTFDDAFSTSAPRNGYSPPAGSPPVTAAPRFVSPQILARQSGPASPTLDEDEDRPLSQLTDRGRRSNSPPTLRSRLSISPPPQHAKASKIAKESDASGSKSSKLGLHFPFGKRNKKDKEQKAAGKKNVVGGEPESVVDERGAFVPRRGRSGLTPISQDVIGSAGPDDDIAAVKVG